MKISRRLIVTDVALLHAISRCDGDCHWNYLVVVGKARHQKIFSRYN